jgi:hypothetical protein
MTSIPHDLIVVCPSFRRPDAARELFDSFQQTASANSMLRFAVWNEDPTAAKYASLPTSFLIAERMTPRTNAVARWAARAARYVGWVADDMRFRTPGWDRIVVGALDRMRGGVVFGNDMQSPGSKPSHVFLSAEIVRALGWLHHPGMVSTFGDDVWEHIGRGLGKYRYLPEIVVEHLYAEKDNIDAFLQDMEVFQAWVREDAEDQIAACRRELKRSVRSSSISTASSPTPTATTPPA